MLAWEYHLLTYDPAIFITDEELITQALGRVGGAGWELVSVIQLAERYPAARLVDKTGDPASPRRCALFFKRQVKRTG